MKKNAAASWAASISCLLPLALWLKFGGILTPNDSAPGVRLINATGTRCIGDLDLGIKKPASDGGRLLVICGYAPAV